MGELFSSPIGLLSLFTIVFSIVIGLALWRFIAGKMDEDSRNQN